MGRYFWQWMVYKDDVFFVIVEFLVSVMRLWGVRYRRWGNIGRRMLLTSKSDSKEAVIVLNAPSIKSQPLENLCGRTVIFANQGFRLPQYKQIHPKYHVFVDTKMVKGVWDIKWLDQIHDMIPDITFVMPSRWATLPLMKPYIEKGYNIAWLNEAGESIRGFGVAQVCFKVAELIGCKRVYVTGFEDTGFAASLVSDSSHFYGRDADELNRSPEMLMQGYYMNARHVRELIRFARKMAKKGVEIINVTRGGVVSEFKRENFEDVFGKVRGR